MWKILRKKTIQITQPPNSMEFNRISTNEENAIRDALHAYGIDEQTVKMWIAVSAFETSSWTSKVFKASNNLFCLIVPGSNKLPYGEGQTIYPDLDSAAKALYKSVLKPFAYPLSFTSISDLVSTMKSKGYFTGNQDTYLAGVKEKYLQLFNVAL